MKKWWQIGCVLVLAGTVFGALYAQHPFRQYPSVEGYETMPLPPDWEKPAEWTFARLMYPPGPLDGYYPRFQGDWREGLSLWTQDYPRRPHLSTGGPASYPYRRPICGAGREP